MTSTEAHVEIIRRLNHRHADCLTDREVYVPDAVGARAGSQRIDFFSIACSWAHPMVTAYEVKVTRQDFVRDNKWPAYLPCCHQLIFATAHGICQLSEIPDQCGWVELSVNGKTLTTKKKAPRRTMEPQIEAFIYKHLLMRHGKRGVPTRDQWNEWLEQKRADRDLGRVVGREIRQTIRTKIDDAKRENDRLQKWCENMEEVTRSLRALGVDEADIQAGSAWRIQQKIRRSMQAASISQAMDSAPALADQLRRMAERLDQAHETAKNEAADKDAA